VPSTAPVVAPVEPDDDDEEPVETQSDERVRGKGGLMNEKAISDVKAQAAARARRKTLIDLYGTADEEKVKAIRAEQEEHKQLASAQREKLSAYEKQEEERKRASMSEVDQLKADIATKDAKILKLEADLSKATRDVMTERQSVQIERAAVNARIKTKFVRLLNSDLATHYQSLTQAEKKLWSGPNAPKQLERWVSKWARENADCVEPVAAPKAAATTVEEPKVEKPAAPKAPIRRPIGAARPAPQPPKAAPTANKGPGVDSNGKTVKPGKGQMSYDEMQAHLAKSGRKMPYPRPAPAFTAPSKR
jgi:hypothetical protein